MPTAIVLATLNARYAHVSLALGYLGANLGPLREVSMPCEFVLGATLEEVVEQVLVEQPRIVGLSVSIRKVAPLRRVVALLEEGAPDVVVVLGGPEVSHEVESQRICALADYVVTGWGEVTFARLARTILDGQRPAAKVHAGEQPPLDRIRFPYDEFSDKDLRRRTLYVEASRGRPFTCAFCLSALDRTAWPFPLEPLIAELERLKGKLAAFPAGMHQSRIGVHTFNSEAQVQSSRPQDDVQAEANLRWLHAHTTAHLHADLISGLPGEDPASFGAGFDRLMRIGPHEIQVGILTRLRGAPVCRHAERFGLVFSPDPPSSLLASDRIDRATMQRLTRFARYWDLGRLGALRSHPAPLLGDAPFERFLAWSDWFFAQSGKTHGIPLEQMYEGMHVWLSRQGLAESATESLRSDYAACGARGRLSFDPTRRIPPPSPKTEGTLKMRQTRHLRPRTRSSC